MLPRKLRLHLIFSTFQQRYRALGSRVVSDLVYALSYRSMNILLIEDDARVASHVLKGLREAGHWVVHETDGRAALLRASVEPYDLIILDRMLPSVDGMKILRTIRATGDTTPVLILKIGRASCRERVS
jgi:two-component system OmpR family response regulator